MHVLQGPACAPLSRFQAVHWYVLLLLNLIFFLLNLANPCLPLDRKRECPQEVNSMLIVLSDRTRLRSSLRQFLALFGLL